MVKVDLFKTENPEGINVFLHHDCPGSTQMSKLKWDKTIGDHGITKNTRLSQIIKHQTSYSTDQAASGIQHGRQPLRLVRQQRPRSAACALSAPLCPSPYPFIYKLGPRTALQSFSSQLNAAEIAAVVTYERNAWGNDMGDMIQPREIHAMMNGGQ